MLTFPSAPQCLRILAGGGITVLISSFASAQDFAPEHETLRSALIPKREVGADTFMAEYPTYDGRGVVIAVFDTGVDPAAAGLAVTTTGERKVLDMIDASGSGDVDTTTVAEAGEGNTLEGLSGIKLQLPGDIQNPSGEFRLGLKPASELFPRGALSRLRAQVRQDWEAELSLKRKAAEIDEDEALEAAAAKAETDRTREERDLIARHEILRGLEDGYASSGPGIVYDCVVWNDGTDWRTVIDTNRNGDLSDDLILRPYGIAGEYGTFDAHTNATYGVQIYEDGDLLSIVTMSGTHGTHVASITASNFPDEPGRNGVAPGAQILSIKIGDVRVGGGSYGPSERRAIATAARYGVDIVNASWGGSSVYQDGGDHNAMSYKLLADRFDILAIMSAGNEGPALSTAGSAGGESSRVLGVGAYASEEMGKALYNTIKDSPDAALQFSSRGPTKDGDIGVDVMAPGAAWASISAESLGSAGMYNGTSMSAPSTSGVAALVLSAAKQNNVTARPALMRNALMLGASPILGEAHFTRGAGLVNAAGAWAKLQELSGQPAFETFYDVEVSGGTFVDTGRGLYLRQPLDELRRSIGVAVSPHWPESTDSDARFKFDEDLVLKPSQPWIESPSFMHMANGAERLRLHLQIPERSDLAKKEGDLILGRVDAMLAGKEELGAIFTIPLTVVRPADADIFEDQILKTSLNLEPAMTARRFYAVPDNAETLKIKVKHTAEDPISRRFFLQVVTLAAEQGQHHYKTEDVAWFEEGEERTMLVPVRGGGVTELAFNQYFYSPESTELELELEWMGVGLKPNVLAIEPSLGYQPVEIAPLADAKVKVKADLTHAVQVSLPKTTEDYYDDERSERPASPLTPGPQQDRIVRLTYEVNFEEPVTAVLGSQQAYDLSEGFTGGRLKVVHESGEVLYNSFPDADSPIDFPNGKTTIIGEQSTMIPGILDSIKTLPVLVGVPLKPVLSLGVLPNHRARYFGGPSGNLSLHGGRQHVLMLNDTVAAAAAELSPSPDYLAGKLGFTRDDDHEITSTRLVYFPGDAPSKVTDQDPEATPGDDLKMATEKFSDSVFDLKLGFAREHRLSVDEAIATRRMTLLNELEEMQPDSPDPLVERAIEGAILAGLTSKVWGEVPSEDEGETNDSAEEEPAATVEETAPTIEKAVPSEEQIIAWLDRAEELAQPTEVSQFFGAKPVALPGDLERRDEIAAEEKLWAKKRTVLATVNRLRADIHRADERWDDVWSSWAELKRWESDAADETKQLQSILYSEAGLQGLALRDLNTRIEEDPFNAGLLKERIALYRELGWESFAVADERLLALRAANLQRINVL